MYKKCVSEQASRRQRQLEEGLMHAMCSQPFEDISISRLCDQLDVPRKCFYRYFSGKDGALCALIDHTIMDFSLDLVISDRIQAIDTLEQFFLFWRDRRLLLTALERSQLSHMLISRSLDYTMGDKFFANAIMPLHSGLKKDYVVNFMITGLISLVLQWHRDDYRDSPHQMALTAEHLMTQPFFPAKRM